MHRRFLAVVGALTLGASGLVAAVGASASASPTPERVITLVGALQDELGCESEWIPACDASELEETNDGVHEGEFTLPGGSYEFKVTVDGAWDENYGLNGVLDGPNIPLVLGGEATLHFQYDDTTHRVTVSPTDLPGRRVTAADRALAQHSLRKPLTRERFYFVLADRFANGDATNDDGGYGGGALENGFDPTDKGFYHGGDLAGIIDKLDYIEDLGTTAIWLTPSFVNKPVQGSGDAASAGYHGYWVTDFTRIDPHLGTNTQMRRLIRLSHQRGIKVFFDIITNHTADVISYDEGQFGYVDKTTEPYRDAAGNPFDDRDFIDDPAFPELDPAVSFPYTPVIGDPDEADLKVPAWLNDPRWYHNRGDSTFSGESSTYGDFSGLDDLFTEHPRVVAGMEEIYAAWVDFGIDGFRIDTAKHVNTEFWQSFGPAMLQRAEQVGNDDFFMFGEVFDADPAFQSIYSTEGRLPATVDFGFQAQAVGLANGNPTSSLAGLFAADDYYTDTDSNAYNLPTFLGNHDMGRVGLFVGGDLAKSTYAHALMYTLRGQPVVYYGDEQGFTGDGGDKDARQDMFASQVESYNDDVIMGGTSGSRDRYGTASPLYRRIARLAALRDAHPTLADGAQIPRFSSDSAGLFAVSRVGRRQQVEYLVVANNSDVSQTASFDTYTPRARFVSIHGGGAALRSDRAAEVEVTIPALSVRVYRADRPIDTSGRAPRGHLQSPVPGAALSGRQPIRTVVPAHRFVEVSTAYRQVGTSAWSPLGTDDNAPYRVMHDVSNVPSGTLLEYRSVVRDARGRVTASSSYGVVGTPEPHVGGPVGDVEQPGSVTVAGSLNSEMGCAADWDPACPPAQLTLDDADDIWKGTFALPAGSYEFKAAINGSWDENYGAGAVANGPNIALTTDGSDVTFYYDHRTHLVWASPPGDVVVATGTFQSELGCATDSSSTCMRSWLQDPEQDGVSTLSLLDIPAGDYDVRAAVGLDDEEIYGAGGVLDGDPIPFTVDREGMVVTFVYDAATHLLSVSTTVPVTPDLGTATAFWVDERTIAYPEERVPVGWQTRWLRFRLHWGDLAIDATSLGGRSAALRVRHRGAPQGYVALRLTRSTQARRQEIMAAPMRAVGVYDDADRVVDATGLGG